MRLSDQIRDGVFDPNDVDVVSTPEQVRADFARKAERQFCDVARRVLSVETFTRIMEIARIEVKDDG